MINVKIWAQAFVDFLPGKRLRDRSRQDIETFLADLGKRTGNMDWQARQAEHDLKILYEAFLPGYCSDGMIKPMPDIRNTKGSAVPPGMKI